MKTIICLILFLSVIVLAIAIRPNTSYCVEEIVIEDTIAAYMGADGIFEIPLDALVKQQRVRIYFRVSKGKANAALYDHAGKKIKSEPDFALLHF